MYFNIIIIAKRNHIFRELWKELLLTGTESWRPHQVFLNLLSCGQQHEQADEAVLQCAEVLWGEREACYCYRHITTPGGKITAKSARLHRPGRRGWQRRGRTLQGQTQSNRKSTPLLG